MRVRMPLAPFRLSLAHLYPPQPLLFPLQALATIPCAIVQDDLGMLKLLERIPVDARMHDTPAQPALGVLLGTPRGRVALERHVVGAHDAQSQVLEAVLEVLDPVLVERFSR